MPKQIVCPIFIVGTPRSGTNIFYRTFAKHPDLAWVSNITKKVPSSLSLTRILMLFRNDHRPTEANNIWQKFTGDDDESRDCGGVTTVARKYLRKVLQSNLQLFNKPRFVNKCPGNSVRIEFLKEIFPDAIFIHIIRDGRTAAYSIMRSRLEHSGSYWSVKLPGRQDDLLQEITTGMKNRNFKWHNELQDADKNTLNVLMGDFLRQLGYETENLKLESV